jgi:uncharacterized protein YfaP (DUF2135 family)
MKWKFEAITSRATHGLLSIRPAKTTQVVRPATTQVEQRRTTSVVAQGRFRVSDNQSSCVFLNRNIRSVARSPNERRIVLTWGATPLELDAHIYTSEGGHIKYTDAGEMTDAIKKKNITDAGKYTDAGEMTDAIKIEMDSVRGYGPETVMIKVSSQLAYSFSVFWPIIVTLA